MARKWIHADYERTRLAEIEMGLGHPEEPGERVQLTRRSLVAPAPSRWRVFLRSLRPGPGPDPLWFARALWRAGGYAAIVFALLIPDPIELAAPLALLVYAIYRAGLEDLR